MVTPPTALFPSALGGAGKIIRKATILGLVLGCFLAGGALAGHPGYTLDTDPIRLGDRAFAAGNLDAAAAAYQEAAAAGYKQTEALWGLARIELAGGQDHAAANHCLQALAADPNAAEIRAGLGIALLRQGNKAEAREAIAQALDSNPDPWIVAYARAMVALDQGQVEQADRLLAQGKGREGLIQGEDFYHHGMALLHQARNDLPAAETAIAKAVILAPGNPTYTLLQAAIYQAEDLPALAVPVLENLVNTVTDERKAALRTRLGQLYETQRRFNDAKDQYLMAIAADSTCLPALKDLASLYRRAKRPAQAASCYRKLASLKPDSAVLWVSLASALEDAKRPNQALAAARRALALAPADSSIRTTFALIGLHAGDDSTRTVAVNMLLDAHDSAWTTDDALAAAHILAGAGRFGTCDSLLAAVATGRQDTDRILFQRGMISLRRDDAAAAVGFFAGAVDSVPDNPVYRLNLGIAHFRAGDLPAAIGDFRSAISLRDDLETAHLLLAQALAMTGDLAEAEKEYTAVLAKSPDNAKAMRGTAFCRLRRGAYSEAVDFYRRATIADPGNADGWAGLGTAQLGQGRLDEADAAFAKARAIDPRNPMLETGSQLLATARKQGKESAQQ